MKYYTEEEVQEIVLRAVFAGWDVTDMRSNARYMGVTKDLMHSAEASSYISNPHKDELIKLKAAANAILKELNVQEI